MAITVRPATPHDVPLLAQTALLASRSHVSRGAWDLCFPGGDEESLGHLRTFAVAEPPSFFHWSVGLVAEADGVPGAALCAAASGAIKSLDPTVMIVGALTAHGWTATHLAAMDRRLAPFLSCNFETSPHALLIENVGTLPALRRRGLVRALLERALADYGKAGGRLAQLTILIGNTAAQRAYEAVGFRVVAEKRTAEFAAVIPGCPGLALMQCAV